MLLCSCAVDESETERSGLTVAQQLASAHESEDASYDDRSDIEDTLVTDEIANEESLIESAAELTSDEYTEPETLLETTFETETAPVAFFEIEDADETEDANVSVSVSEVETDAVSESTADTEIESAVDVETESATEDETEVETESTPETSESSSDVTFTYVVNNNTKKFHYSDCANAAKIKSKNRSEFTGTRDELIDIGYAPCKNCNP